ncbi:MAG: hypothetical protein GX100_02060, partial [candidate division WS1 bacterium]|nr:hypothetical protein [candidate division WS1 bacterium]
MHGLRYQKFGWLWGVVGLSVGLGVLGLVTAALAEPGLVGQYYGNREFWYHGGQLELPSLEVAQDLNRLKWPAPNWDASKGPLFQRGGGWSLAVYGSLRVEEAGSYRFFAEGPEAKLWLGEREVALDGTPPVALEAGEVPLRLYLRSDSPLPDWRLNFHLRWQRPGQGEAEAIPAEVWSHRAADRERTRVFQPEFPLEAHQVRFFHRRDYEVTLPADGFYELAGHFPGVPRQIELTLDGEFLYHHLGRSHLDPAGPSDYGFDFLNRARVVRYLSRGRHTITVAGYQGNYPFEQKSVENFFQQSRWGVSRVPAGDPAASRSLYLPAREDLVFRRGEPLVVRVEQATQEAAEYQLEVVRQRGEGPAAVSARVQLPAGQARAVGELRYPCAEEGAFECVVRDAQGEVVAGPWAFVVVDPTPLPRPGPSAELPELRRVRVDQVDCTQPEDREHRLRDNGTSRVVQGPAGAYRVTGDRPKRQAYYKMKQPLPGLIPLEQAEPGAAHYDVMDWFAYTLRVEHPGRPHVVTAYVPNDVPRLVSVWGYDQVTGQYNAAALEAGNAPASPAFSPLSFLMWPNGEAVDVLVFCDASPSRQEPFSRQGAVARLELYELPEGLPPLPAPVGGFVAEREFGWAGEQVNLGMEQRMMPALWPEGEKVPGVVDRFQWHEGAYMDWKALATTWERFGELSRWRGDRLVVWPVNSYSMGRLGELEYMERDFESYTRSYRARLVDPRRRDQFKLMLLLAEKYGVKLVADFQMSRWYDFVLLATDTEGRYGAEGLFVTDANGKNVNYPAQILNPAHPLSREYMVRWAEEIGRRYGGYPAFAGIGMRQGGWHTNNSGFFYSRNFGYDDFMVGLFEQETGHQIPVKATGEERFGQRREYLLGELEEEWLRWRCEKCTSLREALLEALRQHAPQARLYSSHGGVREDFFDLRSGSGIAPELRGRRELGYGEVLRVAGPHIENGALDPVGFANFDVREPAELRRTLETALGNRGHEYPSNPCAGAGSTLRPHPYQLEPLARALAEGELETVLYGGPWILP